MKLKEIYNQVQADQNQPQINIEEVKMRFNEQISTFKQLGEGLYNLSNYKKIAEQLSSLAESAEQYLILVRVGLLRLFVRCGRVLIVGRLRRRLRGRGLVAFVRVQVLVFLLVSCIAKLFVLQFSSSTLSIFLDAYRLIYTISATNLVAIGVAVVSCLLGSVG